MTETTVDFGDQVTDPITGLAFIPLGYVFPRMEGMMPEWVRQVRNEDFTICSPRVTWASRSFHCDINRGQYRNSGSGKKVGPSALRFY